MKRILVTLTALILVASCMLAFCACGQTPVLPGPDQDVTLGGSGDGSTPDAPTPDTDDDDVDLGVTDSTDNGGDEVKLDPDTVPATAGLIFRLNDDEKSYRVLDYFSKDGNAALATEVYIPYTYEGLPVTAIGYGAFDGVETLESVVLPKTLVSIGDYAFRDCKALVTLDIPATLKSIGVSAFDGCAGIAQVNVDAANETYSSVGNCLVEKSTATVILGTSAAALPDDGSVKAIAHHAFAGSAITSIVIPESVTSIGRGAFADCAALESVTLPAGLTVIEDATFTRCVSLGAITIPETVTSIGISAFDGCIRLLEIEIPAAVTEIGNCAFNECKSIASVTFNEGLKTIGGEAFSGCAAITHLTLPLTLERIGTMAFRKCTMLNRVDFNPVYKQVELSETNLVTNLDSNLVSIGNGAFYDCYSLEFFVIPRLVKTLEAYAFYGCSNENFIIYCEAASSQIAWQTNWNNTTATFIYYSNTSTAKTTWCYQEVDGVYQIVINQPAS